MQFDLKMINLEAEVLINGEDMPDDNYYAGYGRGWLVLREIETTDEVWLYVGETGPAKVTEVIFGSSYDVYFVSNNVFRPEESLIRISPFILNSSKSLPM